MDAISRIRRADRFLPELLCYSVSPDACRLASFEGGLLGFFVAGYFSISPIIFFRIV